jgi:hypothetical protein
MKMSIITRNNKLEMRMGRLDLGVHILYGFYCKKKLEEKILKICINVFNEICMCIFIHKGRVVYLFWWLKSPKPQKATMKSGCTKLVS